MYKIDGYKIHTIIEAVKKLPLKKIAYTLNASLILSFSVSLIVSFILMPDAGDYSSVSSFKSSKDSVVIKSRESLDPAEIREIISRNIFNREGKVPSEEAAASEQTNVNISALTKSSLNVKITGVIFGGGPFTGIVMIESSKQNRINSFMVGETILGEAKILEIWPDRVIIERNNRQEYLEVPQYDIVRSSRKKKRSSSSSSSKSKKIGFAQGSVDENYSEEGFDRKKENIVMTQSYKEKLLGPDFAKILQDAKATPHVVDGEIKGYSLSRIREDSIWQKSGFMDGDIIEEINGVPLSDTGKVVQYLNSLRSATSFEIRYSRGGSTVVKNMEVQ